MKKRYIISFIVTLGMLALTSEIWLLKNSAYIDYYLFVIIFICGYLISLKMTDYLADFKTIFDKSRIEIVFLSIFFILLFIPMSHISSNDISRQENRLLTKWKPFLTDSGINYNFGKDFENWYNDRFQGRRILISLYNRIKCLYLPDYSVSDKGIIDNKNKILYNSFEVKINNYSFKYIKNLYAFNKFCESKGIKLYILVVPHKPRIYPPAQKTGTDFSKNQEYIKRLQSLNKDKQLNIIYPYDEMLAQSKAEYTYFKTEHHWTDDGAYTGYKALMNRIKKDYPNVRVLNNDDFEYFYNNYVRGGFEREFKRGSTCSAVSLPGNVCKKFLNVNFRYYKHKNIGKLNTKVYDEEYYKGKDFYYPDGADLRVVLIGTSMIENLTEFFPFTFRHVRTIRTNGPRKVRRNDEFKIMDLYKEKIFNYKPDIIIFCVTEGNIGRLYPIMEKK